jgi:hypothetical protein
MATQKDAPFFPHHQDATKPVSKITCLPDGQPCPTRPAGAVVNCPVGGNREMVRPFGAQCRQRGRVESDELHCCLLHTLTSANGIIRAHETKKLTDTALSEVEKGEIFDLPVLEAIC